MRLRIILNRFAAAALLAVGTLAGAQEPPARRLSNVVAVVMEEYRLAVDANGRLVSQLEYGEAVDFLKDAKLVAARLSGDRADLARALLDTIILGVDAKRPPDAVAQVHARFVAALGAEGALELPNAPIDLAQGKAVYDASCASCHGALGLGDGPAAKGMTPPPPAFGDPVAMFTVSPALMYRVVSVGIANTPMQSFSNLSVEQRWNVVSYITTLRAPEPKRLEGEGAYVQNCIGCHGPDAEGRGALAAALTRLPPEIGSFAWQAERSDEQIVQAIRNGVPGTAMPAYRDLTDAEATAIVAHVRSIAASHPEAPAALARASAQASSGEETASRVMQLLDRSLVAARGGRAEEANELAFDAYITFEPLERTAVAKSPGLVASMERHFAEFKGSVRSGDVRAAERSRNAVEDGMPQIVALTRPTGGTWGSFMASFLIILREGLEAILVIGAIVTFLIKTGHRERLRSIWVGVGLALVASAITAVILATVLRALPATREVIEGVTMLVAVAVLFSVSYWLISKVEAAKWQAFIRDKVNDALSHGGGRALVLVAFLAVYREGAETALFYQALFNEGTAVMVPIALGIVAGAGVLAVVFTMVYRYGVRIPLRPFFAVTSALLYYMAFVFMGKGIRELQEGNVVPITVLPGWPHLDAMGIYPSVETLLGQLVLALLFAFALLKTFWPKRSVALPTVPPEPARAAAVAPDVAERLASIQQSIERIETRLAEIEQGAVAGKN